MSATDAAPTPAPTNDWRQRYATYEEFVASAVVWNKRLAERPTRFAKSSLSWLRNR